MLQCGDALPAPTNRANLRIDENTTTRCCTAPPNCSPSTTQKCTRQPPLQSLSTRWQILQFTLVGSSNASPR